MHAPSPGYIFSAPPAPPQRKVLHHRVRMFGRVQRTADPTPTRRTHVARVCACVRAHGAGRRVRMPACSAVASRCSLRPPPAFLPRRLPVTSRRGNVRCAGMEEHVRASSCCVHGGPEPTHGRHGVAASCVHLHLHPCIPIYSGPKATGTTNSQTVEYHCCAVPYCRWVTGDRRNKSIAG